METRKRQLTELLDGTTGVPMKHPFLGMVHVNSKGENILERHYKKHRIELLMITLGLEGERK